MKAILEFELPEYSIEHMRAVKAGSYYTALLELKEILRNITKHNPENCNDDQLKIYRHINEILYQIMKDNDIDVF